MKIKPHQWMIVATFLANCAQAAVLRVVTDDNYPPYLYRNPEGKIQGYEADIWKLWEQKTGIKVDLMAMQWADAQRRLLDGKADVIDMIFRTPERESLYDFSEPYVKQSVAIYVDTSISGIHNVDDLKGFQIGVEAGDACVEKLHDSGVLDLRPYSNYSDMIESASKQQIKMFCLDEKPANYYLYKLNLYKKFNKAFVLYQASFHQAVKKGNAAELRLVEQGMREITPREKDALRQKWYGEAYPQFRYSRVLVEIVASLLLLLGASMAWLKSLRSAVRSRTSELERERAHWRTLVENSPDPIWLKNEEGVYLTCNHQAALMLGKTPQEVIGKKDADLMGQNLADQLRSDDLRAIQSGRQVSTEEWMPGTDGKPRLLETVKLPVQGSDENFIGVLGVARDITERKSNELKLANQASMLKEMSRLAHIGAWEFDPVSGEGTWTEEVALIHEVDTTDSTNMSFGLSFYMGESRQAIEQAIGAAISSGTPYDLELELVTAKGNRKWVRTICHPLIEEGKVMRVRGTIQDITERKRVEAQVEHLAFHDQLTGLPNRRLFRDRLEQDMKRVMRDKSSLALLFIDLDRFKEVNDTLGHDKGDILLIEAAKRIRQHVRDSDTVARLGGDEFSIILPDYGEMSGIDRVVREVLQALEMPFDLGNRNVGHISGSIGIALYPHEAESIDDLLRHADQAMYAAKSSGSSRFSYFTRKMQDEARNKLDLTNDLRHALELKQLEVYFQPIVDARSSEIVKAEALLRWHHPERGDISPVIFIPLAEESGLILEIGDWVFKEALRNIATWQKNTGKLLQVSVNKSSAQFMREDRPRWRESYLNSGLPEHVVTVEITESLLLSDSERVRNSFDFFKEHGIELSIDDFGTGFSALSYLHRFDVDYLKVDKSFVQKMTADSSSRALTEAIIIMAHKLDIRTIAEGVETEEQRDLLRSFGCDYLQGFLFSKPVPASEFEKMIGG
jgi:diguanylate cyclase (GGDEF)-like protein/PAS domain S-box-containing protein